MRILWINQHAAVVGGAERYLLDTATLAAARGHQSHLLYDVAGAGEPAFHAAFAGSFPLVDLTRQVEEIAPDLIYVQRWTERSLVRTLAGLRVPTLRFYHDYDLFCLRRHKITGVRRRTCERTIGWRCYPCLGFINRAPGFPGLRLSRLGRLRAEQAENRALAGAVVGSRFMADHLIAHGFDPARVHAIPLFATPPEPAAPVARERGLLLFVGQLIRGKALDTVLRALPAGARLAVAGTGAQEGGLRDLAARLGVADRVQFLGRLDRDALAGWYRRASAVVVPSRYPETFGLVGVEAFAHGAPVVATRVGGTGEWLDHERTGLAVPPDDVPALAAALTRVLGDGALAARLGAAGLAAYHERFQPEHHVDRLLALGAAVVAAGVAPAASVPGRS